MHGKKNIGPNYSGFKTLPHVTISSTISSTMENISIVDDDFDDGNDIVEAGHVNL